MQSSELTLVSRILRYLRDRDQPAIGPLAADMKRWNERRNRVHSRSNEDSVVSDGQWAPDTVDYYSEISDGIIPAFPTCRSNASIPMASSQPTHVSLTPLDHLHRPNYIKICYWIPLLPSVQARDVYTFLGAGLRKTFHQMPWLGGKVHLQSPNTPGWRPGQREIRYEAWAAKGPVPRQLVFKQLDTELSYSDWKDEGFPSDAFPDQELLDVPVEGDMEAGCDIWAAQTSFIPGGLILTMSTCHAAIDGTGMVIAMKAWADCCRSAYDGLAGGAAFPPETYDRSLLDKLWEQEGAPVPADPDTWTKGLVGLEGPEESTDIDAQREGTRTPSTKKAVHKTFYLPASSLATLQKQCDESAQSGTALSISDIITALMWRGSVRARNRVAGDAMALRLQTSNTTFYNQAKLPIASVLDLSVPLSRLASAVRVGAARINSASLNDAYGLLRALPDYETVRPRFRRAQGADMLISNLLVFPVNDIAFGDTLFGNGGKAEALRCYLGRFNDYARCSLVLPRRPGGVEITMNLREDEMEGLEADEEWGRYCLAL
ncbi:hypothetical protein G7Y89_g14424 [Cudoniella acicularis]|uniref:Trichothecene 3-O-acetyltransferase-like N-terminal domain-containing protein n=1 Tax=Cudoniella acicularis TaxID=354080 RepID=A0A8H4R201_9HELO|nr:hypothetical protein G7Y89_g14424 [Cudoniella acicularis]